jgi:hypothetical protein
MLITQPPCPEASSQRTAAISEAQLKMPIDPYDTGLKNEEAVLVGTERWCATEFSARTWARGCWVQMHTGEKDVHVVEEVKWWPKGLRLWSVGAWMEDGVFEFPEALEWKL